MLGIDTKGARAMSNGLKPRQLAELKAALVERARQLRDEIRQTLAKSDSEHYLQIADSVRDLEDQSFADLIVDINLAEIDRDLEELREVDAALLHIGDGRYGICDACARPIGLDRLRASPSALRCIDCQTVHERTHYRKVGHTL
jgi:RNA polymerase-binding protein DksA